MVSIMWVEGSPKGERSLSSRCARAFLSAVEAETSEVTVTHRDVWDGSLVHFGREAALAKFGPLFGEPHTPEQEEIWRQVEAEIELVAAHDLLVVSSPMWNWSVPHALKAWIDVIVQPLKSFTIDREGRHVGVMGVDKQAQLILTRSSAYDGRSPEITDHQAPYLTDLFTLLGYELPEPVIVEPTTAWTPEEREAIAADAVARAEVAGRALSITNGVRPQAKRGFDPTALNRVEGDRPVADILDDLRGDR